MVTLEKAVLEKQPRSRSEAEEWRRASDTGQMLEGNKFAKSRSDSQILHWGHCEWKKVGQPRHSTHSPFCITYVGKPTYRRRQYMICNSLLFGLLQWRLCGSFHGIAFYFMRPLISTVYKFIFRFLDANVCNPEITLLPGW